MTERLSAWWRHRTQHASRRRLLGIVSLGLGALLLGTPPPGRAAADRRRRSANPGGIRPARSFLPRKQRRRVRLRLRGAVTVPPDAICLTTGTPCRLEMAGGGFVTPMAQVSFSTQFSFTIDPTNPPADGCVPLAGTLTLRTRQVSHRGRVKARAVNAVACLVNNGDGATLRGDFEIFHGTGSYRGATGRVRWRGTASEQVTITGSGTIRY